MSVNTNMDIFKNARIYVSRVFTELIRRKRKNLKIKRYETLFNPVTSQYSTNLLKYHDFTTTSTVSSKRSKQNAAHNFNLSPKYQKRDKRRYIQLQSRSTQKSFEFSASFLLINSFHFLTVLGRGQYGKVFLAHFRPTGRYYAVKAIKKEYLISSKTIQTVFTEKKIFEIIKSQRNKSPFLVKMFTCFQTVENIFFAIEYAGGGDLVTNLMKEKAYSEKRACFYAACITLALKFLHENLILYRDLKLDNCLIGLDGYLKITDFGISKFNFDYSDRTSTFCGTESYMAPEILLRLDYSRSVDWWALGVIVYEMILGQLPFSNRYQQITQAVYYPHKISRNSKDFIEKLLFKNEKARLGSSRLGFMDVQKHPFFKSIDWNDLQQKRIRSPYIPLITRKEDTSQFSSIFTKEEPCLTPLKESKFNIDEYQSLFDDFGLILHPY